MPTVSVGSIAVLVALKYRSTKRSSKTRGKLGGSMTKRTCLVLNFFGAVLLLIISTVVGFAQTSGEMSGLVTDPSGAAISGASVTITNKATSATRSVTTNSEGLYSFPSLLPGV